MNKRLIRHQLKSILQLYKLTSYEFINSHLIPFNVKHIIHP